MLTPRLRTPNDLQFQQKMETCTDIATEVRGQSCQKHDAVVRKHFAKFSGSPVSALVGKPHFQLREMYGKFAKHLLLQYVATGVPGVGTALNYLSSLSQIWKKELFDNSQGIFSDEPWYHTVRTTMQKQYAAQAQATGKRLVNSPDPLTEEVLASMCEHLLGRGGPRDAQNRAFVVLNGTCSGGCQR